MGRPAKRKNRPVAPETAKPSPETAITKPSPETAITKPLRYVVAPGVSILCAKGQVLAGEQVDETYFRAGVEDIERLVKNGALIKE